MTYFILRILLVLAVVFGATGVQAEFLRVVSLNAEWFPGRVPDAAPAQQARHLVAMQQFLYEMNPDVWLVQEVTQTGALTTAYAVLPDYEVYTASDFTGQRHQLAICGRLPLHAAGTLRWPDEENKVTPPRGVAYSAVVLPDDRILLLFTLHMKSNYTGDEEYDPDLNVAAREQEAELFVNFAEEIQQQYPADMLFGLLLAGDLNVLYPRSLFRGERTTSLLETAGFTHLGSHGLDHFWGKGISNTAFRALTEYDVSDHRPVMLELPLPGLKIARHRRRAPAAVAHLAGEIRTNVNNASPEELRGLPGIGPVLAERIMANRPFASIDELIVVCGIGPVSMERFVSYIKVRPPDVEDADDP